MSLDIGQHNGMEIFTVKWNNVSETSKFLLNDILQNQMEVNLGELQVDVISAKLRYDRKCKEITYVEHACLVAAAFFEYYFIFKEQNS